MQENKLAKVQVLTDKNVFKSGHSFIYLFEAQGPFCQSLRENNRTGKLRVVVSARGDGESHNSVSVTAKTLGPEVTVGYKQLLWVLGTELCKNSQ